MSVVNNNSSGIQFISATSESARIGGRVTPAASPAATQGIAPVQDQVAQSAGQQGQAKPVNFLDDSPRLLQFRQYLATGQWESLLPLLESLSTREIAELGLSVEEINKLADGLGKGSLAAALPLVGSYTKQEQQAIQRLIQASTHLSINQRMYLLKENVGPGAVLAFIQTATPAELKKLSAANRQMALSVLDPGNSIWGNVSGATTELVSRRMKGEERLEDRLAGQILKSAANEQELRQLLQTLNQFSRDDAVYHYVMSLSAKELSELSDGMKKELLQHLVDTGVQLPLIHIDLNSIANLDETLQMTFKEHVQAAKLLYTALTPHAQQSQEVKDLVSRSDALMQELAQLEAAIRRDQAAGKLTAEKIAAYREQVLSLQSKYPENPEIRQKIQQLLNTLSSLQQGLKQAASTQLTIFKDMEQVRGTVKTLSATIQSSQRALERLKHSASQAQQQLKTHEEKLLKQYEHLIQLRKRFEGLEPRYTQILQEMENALQNPRTQKSKLAQLETLHQQLKQMERQLGEQNHNFQGLLAEIHSTSESLQAEQRQYNQQAELVNQQRDELLAQQSRLEQHLKQYQTQIARLEKGLQSAQQQFQTLKETGADPADLKQLNTEIQAISAELRTHQNLLQQTETDYRQYLVPEAEQLIVQQQSQEQEYQALEPQLVTLDAGVQALDATAASMDQELSALKKAMHEALEKSNAFLSDWQRRLTSGEAIASDQIQNFKAQLMAQMQELEQYQQAEPEAVAAQLKALKELEATVLHLEKQLKASEQLESQLNVSVQTLQARQQRLETELKDAKEVIALSQQSLLHKEAKLKEIQAQIATMQTDLGQYAHQVQTLENALAARKQEALAAQQKYAQGELEGKELVQLLQANEAERTQLQTRLESMQQAIKRLQEQLDGNLESLQAQQRSLEAERNQLEQAVKQAEHLRFEWEQLQTQNLQQIEAAHHTLKALKSSAAQYPALNPKVQEVEQAIQRLEQKNQTMAQQLEASQQVLVETLPLQRQVVQTMQALEHTATRLSEVKFNELSSVQQEADQLNRTFIFLQEKAAAVQKEREQLEYQLRHANTPFAIADMQAQIEQLIRREGIAAADVQHLLNLSNQLKQMRQVRQQGDQTLRAHQSIRQNHLQHYSAAQQAVLNLRSQVEELETGIAQVEAELQAGKQHMLQTQRQILEMRKSLGITSSDYLQALSRYEALLKRGHRLSAADVQELEALERRLSGIEQQLLSTSETLRTRIGELNQLRSRLNQQIDQLKEKSQALSLLKNELGKSLQQLRTSQQQLLVQRQQLWQQREHLQGQLQHIESLLQLYPGSAELLEIREQLRQELAETDQLLNQYADEIHQTQQDIANSEQLMVEMDQVLESARNIQEKLLLLVIHLDDILKEGQQLLDELTDLQQTYKQQQEAVEHTQTLLASEIKMAEVPNSVATQGTEASFADREASSPLHKLTKAWKESFSSWGRQRQQREAQREKIHQEERDKMLTLLEQQVALARQYERDWKEKNQQMAQFEKLLDLMIARIAATGQTTGPVVNILGVQPPAQHVPQQR